jgi:four helix bundle protein
VGKDCAGDIQGRYIVEDEGLSTGALLERLMLARCSVLLKDKRTVSLADQLYRAVGSVSANLAEGYSRSTGKDRALFYQYALGSARESRDWYYKARFVLGDEISKHRGQVITEILRLLLTMIPQQRGHIIREDTNPYEVNPV